MGRLRRRGDAETGRRGDGEVGNRSGIVTRSTFKVTQEPRLRVCASPRLRHQSLCKRFARLATMETSSPSSMGFETCI